MLPKATQATGSRQEACPGLGMVLGEEEVRVAQLWGISENTGSSTFQKGRSPLNGTGSEQGWIQVACLSRFAWTFLCLSTHCKSHVPGTSSVWGKLGCSSPLMRWSRVGILGTWEGPEGHTDGGLQAKMYPQKVGLLPWKGRDISHIAVAGEETGRSHR